MWHRTEEEVDMIIADMISRSKGKYITQAVAFNKNSESQMNLLKLVLMSSYSFGGFMKELIGEKMTTPTNNKPKESIVIPFQPKVESERSIHTETPIQFKQNESKPNNKESNIGNFL